MRLVSAIWEDGFPFAALPFVADVVGTKDPSDLQKGDLLVVWGGEDISPSLYNKPASRFTGAREIPSQRDRIEWALMERSEQLDIPIIGVCRGAQMLCAFAGGHLIQHVNRHGGTHVVSTIEGIEFTTNSCHHQMMYPFDVKHEMLASIKVPLSTEHWDVDVNIEIPEEPEFVYFPEVKGYAIQWHPEWMDLECEATKYVLDTLRNRLG